MEATRRHPISSLKYVKVMYHCYGQITPTRLSVTEQRGPSPPPNLFLTWINEVRKYYNPKLLKMVIMLAAVQNTVLGTRVMVARYQR